MPEYCPTLFVHALVVQQWTTYCFEFGGITDDLGTISIALLRLYDMLKFFRERIVIKLV